MVFSVSWLRPVGRIAFTGFVLAAMPAALPVLATGKAFAAEASSPIEVKIQNFTFGPTKLTVPVGATVTWVNEDDMPHTITTEDRRIKSPVLDTGDRFSFTFDRPGSITYFCSIHPHMTGTIVVQAKAARAAGR